MTDDEPVADGETGGDASVDKGAVADAALALAGTQLAAQVADEASLDGRATGLVGFSGALLALTAAARPQLGPAWWAPIPVLIIVSVLLIWVLAAGSRPRDFIAEIRRKKPRRTMDIGVKAAAFYTKWAGGSSIEARERLLFDLGEAYDHNVKRLDYKRRWLQIAIAVLIAGLLVAAALITVERPGMMSPCQHHLSQCHSQAEQAWNTLEPADQSPKTDFADHPLLALAQEIERGQSDGPLIELAWRLEGGQ